MFDYFVLCISKKYLRLQIKKQGNQNIRENILIVRTVILNFFYCFHVFIFFFYYFVTYFGKINNLILQTTKQKN
jgi:hypothetical protein